MAVLQLFVFVKEQNISIEKFLAQDEFMIFSPCQGYIPKGTPRPSLGCESLL
jgi:hypothetical protein